MKRHADLAAGIQLAEKGRGSGKLDADHGMFESLEPVPGRKAAELNVITAIIVGKIAGI